MKLKPGAAPDWAGSRSVPTLEDVAKAADVSTATVSRCLNGTGKVSDTARKRVLDAVEALGYTPNFAAKAMAARRTFTIGAIIPTMENAIFARGLQAFQETLHEAGYTLLVASSAYRPEIEADQIRALVARGADGLLLIGHERDPSIYEDLARRGVPTLVSWAWSDRQKVPSVGFDNFGSMQALIRQVVDMGHRRIAYISGMVDGNDRAADRLRGWRAGLAEAGLDADDTLVIEAAYTIDAGAAAFKTLMAGTPRPSVVMCGNDVLAVGALMQARKSGLQVPLDVSVTGFDDIELAGVVSPGLTTVHVPHAQMGRQAAAELIRMVEKQSPGKSGKLESTLKLRESLRSLV